MRRWLGIALFAALAVAAAAGATSNAWRVLDRGAATGDFAVASASGHASAPNALGVRVTVSRRQRINVYAVIGCAKGAAIASRDKRFTAHGSFTRALQLPLRSPADCSLSVTASIQRGGKLTVFALAG
jgi:hypothetical protein